MKRLFNSYQVKHFYNGKFQDGLDMIPIYYPMLSKQISYYLSSQIKEPIDFKLLTKGHNPFYRVQRYRYYGDVCLKLANLLEKNKQYLAHLIQGVMPKSELETYSEIKVTCDFLLNLSGDNIQYLLRGYSQIGDKDYQVANTHHFPYGRVAIICPFNFPLEIPVLQTISAMVTGNIPFIHVDHRVALVMEYFIHLMLKAGVDPHSFIFINGYGNDIEKTLLEFNPQQTIFTGSTKVADHLTQQLNGRIRVEDAGFNWKYIGKDAFISEHNQKILDQMDRDAFELSGQKCSAQRLLFVPRKYSNIVEQSIEQNLINRHRFKYGIVPTLSVSNGQISEHIEKLAKILIPERIIGGKPIEHLPYFNQYGYYQPTTVITNVEQLNKNISYVSTEIFAPIQILSYYNEDDMDIIQSIIQQLPHKLTCAIVTNDVVIQHKLLACSQNGTTYIGLDARTTGTPQNRWFGPGGNPRDGAIGTPEAIRKMWTFPRSIISGTH